VGGRAGAGDLPPHWRAQGPHRGRCKKLTARIAWEKSRADARKLEAAGLGELVGAAPELGVDAERARDCWNFCDGWQPERVPLYDALYGVDDPDLLLELMLVLRRAQA
jgi:hypothetical protein